MYFCVMISSNSAAPVRPSFAAFAASRFTPLRAASQSSAASNAARAATTFAKADCASAMMKLFSAQVTIGKL